MDIEDFKAGLDACKEAAERGDAEAQYRMGLRYEAERDYKQAAKWLGRAARQGGAVIPYNLGSCYQKGIGVAQDYAEAAKWFRKSVEKKA